MSLFIVSIIIPRLQRWGSSVVCYGTFVFREVIEVMAVIPAQATPFNSVRQKIHEWTPELKMRSWLWFISALCCMSSRRGEKKAQARVFYSPSQATKQVSK